jgi:hypothetical protein
MSDETLAERIVRLETQMKSIQDDIQSRATVAAVTSIQRLLDGRSNREWAIIMVGIGLVISILAKNLGWVK